MTIKEFRDFMKKNYGAIYGRAQYNKENAQKEMEAINKTGGWYSLNCETEEEEDGLSVFEYHNLDNYIDSWRHYAILITGKEIAGSGSDEETLLKVGTCKAIKIINIKF